MDVEIRNLWIDASEFNKEDSAFYFQLFSFDFQFGVWGKNIHVVIFNIEITVYFY